MKATRQAHLMAFAACLIVLFTTLVSGCLPRSRHPRPESEELMLGAAATNGQAHTDADAADARASAREYAF